MLIAKPIPPGCTVIARPMMGTNPFTMSQEQMRPLSPSMIKTGKICFTILTDVLKNNNCCEKNAILKGQQFHI